MTHAELVKDIETRQLPVSREDFIELYDEAKHYHTLADTIVTIAEKWDFGDADNARDRLPPNPSASDVLKYASDNIDIFGKQFVKDLLGAMSAAMKH